MRLRILSPQKPLFDGETSSVALPGQMGMFTVLPHHAPLIAALTKGAIVHSGGERVEIAGGFVEVKGDTVTVCAELEQ